MGSRCVKVEAYRLRKAVEVLTDRKKSDGKVLGRYSFVVVYVVERQLLGTVSSTREASILLVCISR